MFGGITLNRGGQNLLRGGFRLLFQIVFIGLQPQRLVMNKFRVHQIEQIFLGLFGCITRYLLKQFLLIQTEFFGFCVFILCELDLVVQSLFLFIDILEFPVEGFFLLKQTLFGELNFLTAFFEFFIGLGTELEDLILGLDHHFFFAAFGIAKSFVLKLRGLFVGVADDLARLAFAFGNTHIGRFKGSGPFGLFSLVLTLGDQISDEQRQDNHHYAYHDRPNGLLVQ